MNALIGDRLQCRVEIGHRKATAWVDHGHGAQRRKQHMHFSVTEHSRIAVHCFISWAEHLLNPSMHCVHVLGHLVKSKCRGRAKFVGTLGQSLFINKIGHCPLEFQDAPQPPASTAGLRRRHRHSIRAAVCVVNRV